MWLQTFAGSPGPADDFWYTSAGLATAAGPRVSPETAMRLAIVYACVRVLSESVAQLPLVLYRRLDRGKQRATGHPLYNLLAHRPNARQTSFEWREQKQAHLALRGNAYSEIRVGRDGTVLDLLPHHPDLVRVVEANTRDGYVYKVRDSLASAVERTVLPPEMLHLRGLATHGIMGLNPIEQEREAIGFTLAAQDHGARFYRNGAQFPGWIEHPSSFKTTEDRNKFREAFQGAQTGGNRFKTPIFEFGVKYHETEIKHTDAQYLETRKHQNEDIARMFRMPPHKVGILDRSTNNNIEHQGIEFVTDTLMPWLVRWEQRLSEQLLTEDERGEYFFEFLVDGLLRGDAATRSEYYSKGVQDGYLTRNEVREMENRNPLPGLDEPLEPLNMARASEPRPTRKNHDAARADALLRAAAERVVRKEITALRRAHEQATAAGSCSMFVESVGNFYAGHAALIVEALRTTWPVAERYCTSQRSLLLATTDTDTMIDSAYVTALLDEWQATAAAHLAAMAASEQTD